LFLTGCNSLTKNTTGVGMVNDPLLGGPGAQPAVAANNPQPLNPRTSLPPLPAPNPGTSTAALAGMSKPGERELRISNPSDEAGNDRNRAGPGAAGDGAGAKLLTPQPLTEPAPREPDGVHTPVGMRSLTVSNTEDALGRALAQVLAREPLWLQWRRLGDTGEWEFSCSVPNRQERNKQRTYKAKAVEKLDAVQAVLRQIDEQR
jgi:hypothetical protein